MDTLYNGNLNQPPVSLIIDQPIQSFLKETIKWSQFIAILGFVFSGLIIIFGIIIMITPDFTGSYRFSQQQSLFAGPFYVLISLLYFFPSRFLYRFSQKIKSALAFNDQAALTIGFESLKSNFKFWGILLLVMIVFYAIVIIGAVAFLFLFKA